MREPTTLRDVLIQMMMISDAAGQTLADKIENGGDPSKPPTGPNRSLAEEHQNSTFEEARLALMRARRREAPILDEKMQLVPGSFFWKCAIADDSSPVEELVVRYSVSRASVYRYRVTYRGLRKTPANDV